METSSLSLMEEFVGSSEIFEPERQALQIWKRVPGALCCGVIQDMRQQLITAGGLINAGSEGSLPPVASQYYRHYLQSQMGAVMGREVQHWRMLMDLLLRGRPAQALDLASQRVKSLKRIAKGAQVDIARRLDLSGPEKPSLVSTQHSAEAGKEHRQEEKIQRRNFRGSYWGSFADRNDGYKGGKGKDKDKGKRDKGKGDGRAKRRQRSGERKRQEDGREGSADGKDSRSDCATDAEAEDGGRRPCDRAHSQERS